MKVLTKPRNDVSVKFRILITTADRGVGRGAASRSITIDMEEEKHIDAVKNWLIEQLEK